jgi:RimJ/RimL family protein N-acetyltransferase
MKIESLQPSALERFERFIARIPEDDRTLAKEDLSDRDTLDAWAHEIRSIRLIALAVDDAAIGYAAIIPGTGLSDHVGELRLLVDLAHRRSGFGRSLVRRALVDGVTRLGLRKIFVEVVAEQDPAIRMFRQNGFIAEAILRDHFRDRSGKMRDLVLLGHFVEDNWEGLRGLGIEKEVG